jgi:hypothetical protein
MAAADAAITAATLPGAHTALDALGGAVTIAGHYPTPSVPPCSALPGQRS